jgi:NDP-sugar pyrophosphorylase family protein
MIIIPMAGLSRRFSEAGYDKPKFMLKLKGLSLFTHSLLSFKDYFKTEKFLFVARNISGFNDFISKEVTELGIDNFEIILLDFETTGQAETVFEGIKRCKISPGESITIFNIDTFRPNFKFPAEIISDGYLEVFKGFGQNWSYVKFDPKQTSRVIETAEKNPISDLCCTGLYFFKYHEDFLEAFLHHKENSILVKGELYVAPLYNFLINKGKFITYNLIHEDDVIFCGIPSEYENLLKIN